MSPQRGCDTGVWDAADATNLGLTPPGYTKSPQRGWDAGVWDAADATNLGLTPPGYKMSPQRRLGCRDMGRGGCNEPGAHATRLDNVAAARL